MSDPVARVAGLACWGGSVVPVALGGGITNRNFLVEDRGGRFVVRLGADIPHHGIMRFNELAVARAAEAAGLAPAIVHAEPGVLVMRHVEGRTLAAEDIREPGMLERIVPLLRAMHTDVATQLRGPVLTFWVFHVLRDYAHTLRDRRSRHLPKLDTLMAQARQLEAAVGAIDLVLGHNDLLPANLIDDGTRLWLIDFDYAGFNSPLFDLGNLATNAALDDDAARHLVALYFARDVAPDLWRRFAAMAAASLLRETLWSMVSEVTSEIAFDYAAYTEDNLARYETAFVKFDGPRPG